MDYKLTVVKIEPNPNYDPQKSEEDRQRYHRPDGSYGYQHDCAMISPLTETRTLEVMLTETEYNAVKQAVITKWQ